MFTVVTARVYFIVFAVAALGSKTSSIRQLKNAACLRTTIQNLYPDNENKRAVFR